MSGASATRRSARSTLGGKSASSGHGGAGQTEARIAGFGFPKSYDVDRAGVASVQNRGFGDGREGHECSLHGGLLRRR